MTPSWIQSLLRFFRRPTTGTETQVLRNRLAATPSGELATSVLRLAAHRYGEPDWHICHPMRQNEQAFDAEMALAIAHDEPTTHDSEVPTVLLRALLRQLADDLERLELPGPPFGVQDVDWLQGVARRLQVAHGQLFRCMDGLRSIKPRKADAGDDPAKT